MSDSCDDDEEEEDGSSSSSSSSSSLINVMEDVEYPPNTTESSITLDWFSSLLLLLRWVVVWVVDVVAFVVVFDVSNVGGYPFDH